MSTKKMKMVNHNSDLISRDLKHVWHPCTQMKDFEQCPPIIVHQAQGSYLHTNHGPLIDGISSWWCKSLGHGHPEIRQAIQNQLDSFEHIIGANTTYPALVELAESLAKLSGKSYLFFASDGSCAVEIAMKLAVHAQQLQGKPHRNQFISLQNGYHGETLGALSVSDLGLYKKPYERLTFPCYTLEHIPYVDGMEDPLWQCCESYWQQTLQQLEAAKETTCAIIVEPIIQGAGGMRCYSPDFLKRLAHWAKAHEILLITDEIMTGLGRTGKWFASEHAHISPDLICLSKGLTSGAMALSCVLIDQTIYDLFYADYELGHSFLHSHTYSGNPLAVSAAVATLKVMEKLQINQCADTIGLKMRSYFNDIAAQTGKLMNIRQVGACIAAELIDDQKPRMGFRFYQEALSKGALLRPLGNTLYWFPPLTVEDETLEKLAEITLNTIQAIYT